MGNRKSRTGALRSIATPPATPPTFEERVEAQAQAWAKQLLAQRDEAKFKDAVQARVKALLEAEGMHSAGSDEALKHVAEAKLAELEQHDVSVRADVLAQVMFHEKHGRAVGERAVQESDAQPGPYSAT